MNTFLRDLRYGIRMLIKSPAFTFVAVLSIALGIGANTAVFSVINTVLLKSLPFKEPDSLVLVWGETREEGRQKDRSQVSATDVADFRSQNSVFEDITTYTGWNPILSGESEAERIPAIQVGDGFFHIMKGEPILGRVFTGEEQEDGKDFVIILSYGLWQRKFAGDPDVIGKTISLNSRPYTIVGVMGADFRPLPTTLVSPEGQFYRPVAEAYDEQERSARHLRSIARLKPGVTVEQAQAEIQVIANRLEQEHPESNTDQGARVVSITEDTVGNLRPTLLMVFGAVVFVLLVACANVANLLLARSSARSKEITIRSALGAGRGQLIRQLMTESLLLSVTGGALGLIFAMWGVDIIESIGSKMNPMFGNIAIDLRCLGFTFAVSILTGILFGLAPALQISRPSLTESLKEGGRASSPSAGSNRLRSALVVAEVALTLILLVCAGLLIQTVMRLNRVDTGFNHENILAMNIGLPGIRYPQPANVISFYKQATDRIAALPGVKAAGLTSVLPLSSNFDGRGLAVEDFPRPRGEEISVDLYVTTPGYLQAMEIRLLKGRLISEQDTNESMKIALINRTMAGQLWGDADVIGKRIKFPGSERNPQPWRTVVGVVEDVTQYALDQKPPMQIYLPHSQFPTSFNTIVVKTEGNPESMIAAVRQEILAVDPEQAVYNVTTLEALLADSILLRRFMMSMLIAFAGLALVLAAVGIYGVMAYIVSQRTREIGIRMALGAGQGQILRLIVGQGMLLAGIGVGIGLVAAFALTRFMSSLLFGITASDPVTFAIIASILIGVSTLACAIPARHALRVDPIEALRYE